MSGLNAQPQGEEGHYGWTAPWFRCMEQPSGGTGKDLTQWGAVASVVMAHPRREPKVAFVHRSQEKVQCAHLHHSVGKQMAHGCLEGREESKMGP